MTHADAIHRYAQACLTGTDSDEPECPACGLGDAEWYEIMTWELER